MLPLSISIEKIYFFIYYLFFVLGVLTIPSVLLKKKRRPVSTLSWSLALLTLPFPSVLFWWFLGRTHLKRKIERKNDSDSKTKSLKASLKGVNFHEQDIVQNSIIETYFDNTELFTDFKLALKNAKKFIFLEFYIFNLDEEGNEILDILIQKDTEGVEVFILLDGLGAFGHYKKLYKKLERTRIKLSIFQPIKVSLLKGSINFRNHRKLALIDCEIAFTGSFNIGKEYHRDWKDIGVQVKGDIVKRYQEVFCDDWYFTTQEDLFLDKYFIDSPEEYRYLEGKMSEAKVFLKESGPDQDYNENYDEFLSLINNSNESINIVTPYFIPDEGILTALRLARKRGVCLKLLVPQKSDVYFATLASKSFYEEILEMGAEIYEYTTSMIHAKLYIIDDNVTVLGSTNLDSRSFRLNFELNTYFLSKDVNSRGNSFFNTLLNRSNKISSSYLESRSKLQKYFEAFAHLLSPLF